MSISSSKILSNTKSNIDNEISKLQSDASQEMLDGIVGNGQNYTSDSTSTGDEMNIRKEYDKSNIDSSLNISKSIMLDMSDKSGNHRNFSAPVFTKDFGNIHNGVSNIDDPIITGFTFSIDTMISPLFYRAGAYLGVNGPEYDLSNGPSDTTEHGDHPLAKSIENRLHYAADLNESMESADPYGVFHIGDYQYGKYSSGEHYSLEPKLYYGPVEYLYMADKRTGDDNKSNDSRESANDAGINNVKSPNKKEYENSSSSNATNGKYLMENFNNGEHKFSRNNFATTSDLTKTRESYQEGGQKYNSVIKKYNELTNALKEFGINRPEDMNDDTVGSLCESIKIVIGEQGSMKEPPSSFSTTSTGLYKEKDKQTYDKLNSKSSQIIKKASDEIKKIDDKIKKENDKIKKIKDIAKSSKNVVLELEECKAIVADLNSGWYETSDAQAIPQLQQNNTSSGNDKIDDNIYAAPITAYNMARFQNGMKLVCDDYPYIFQSVEGLDVAYKKYFKPDPYKGSGDDKITINCLESVDLKISGLFNRYFNAVYDPEYRRERVPGNLRRFNCSIFVHDIRNFKNYKTATGATLIKYLVAKQKGLSGGEILNELLLLAANHISAIEFKFIGCEINQEETGGIFENVSNIEAGDIHTKLSFTYQNCVVNFLPFTDIANELPTNLTIEPLETTKDLGDVDKQHNAHGIFGTFINNGISALKTGIQKMFSENVYEDSMPEKIKEAASLLHGNMFGGTLVQGATAAIFKSAGASTNQTTSDMMKELVHGIPSGGFEPSSISKVSIGDKVFGDPEVKQELDVIGSVYDMNSVHYSDQGVIEEMGETNVGENAFDTPKRTYNTTNLGDAYANPDKSYDTTDLDSAFDNPDKNYTTNIIGTAFDNPDKSYDTTDLDKAFDNPDKSYDTTDLDKAFENPNKSYDITDLDVAYANPDKSYDTTDLDVAFENPDKIYNTNKLGKVYDTEQKHGTQESIGKAFEQEERKYETDKLGVAYENQDKKYNTDDLGNAFSNPNREYNTDDLGNTNDVVDKKEKTEYLGKAYVNPSALDAIKSLGNINK